MTEHAAAATSVKRLILCFDGTWNTPEDHTNVSRIYAAVADKHSSCPDQLKFYDAGVGTDSMSRVRGGALGWGLDRNILQGYAWLINEYFATAEFAEADGERFSQGPDLFVFGFSRGAYTARSLVGLVNRCGVPKAEHFRSEASGRAHANASLVRKAWSLYQKDFGKGVEGRKTEDCVQYRRDFAWTPKVKFIGVWDTVGALGVPMFSRSVLAKARYGFHDTALGRVVEHAYHAVAIDEAREDYKVSLWDRKYPGLAHQVVEQRWFPGAHANVGGGYEDDLLPDPPLKWMAERAIEAGLEFTDGFPMIHAQVPACSPRLPEDFKLRGDEYLSPVRDSYAEFLYGAYRALRGVALRGRYYRRMLVDGVNETVDQTAHMKWAADPRYRPVNLANAGRDDFASVPEPTPVEAPAGPAASGR